MDYVQLACISKEKFKALSSLEKTTKDQYVSNARMREKVLHMMRKRRKNFMSFTYIYNGLLAIDKGYFSSSHTHTHTSDTLCHSMGERTTTDTPDHVE